MHNQLWLVMTSYLSTTSIAIVYDMCASKAAAAVADKVGRLWVV